MAALNDKLVEEAKRLGKHRTKREAVNEAIAEYVASRKRRSDGDVEGARRQVAVFAKTDRS